MAFPIELRKTFLENWPEELLERSFRHEKIVLSVEDTIALGSMSVEFREAMSLFGNYPLSDEFYEALNAGVAKFSEGVMPRLGYCSWKDSTLVHQSAKTPKQVLSNITRPNRRIATALQENAVDGVETPLFLRQWADIPAWSEFRIFMKARKFSGISQYYYRDHFPEIAENLTEVRAALTEFCVEFSQISHMDTVIADVYLRTLPDGQFKARLIELNPYSVQSDPCFYSWDNMDSFDARLVFRQGTQIMTAKLG
ncbi:hypothetical protein [Phyllobacterium sp. YR531]|uniref:hypothetical protein n=1 Tax=Phyllobacterium sp. YR531 TaxID=1144343 RepID=UPI0002E4F1F9|nr:hypothetical protein [Phyllobacterium sp. YR531]